MATKSAANVVQCTIEDGVALVTLVNPPLNVVTLTMTKELNALLKRLATDASVRVLVLTGSGLKSSERIGELLKLRPRTM